jgi:hypothetical protein
MLTRHRNPVAESFYLWLSQHPESTHWADMGRFYVFVNTAIGHNASIWLDPVHLEERVLAARPHFNRGRLNELLIVTEHIRDARKTQRFPAVTIAPDSPDDPRDSFLEVKVDVQGNRTERWRPMSEY